MKSPIRRTATTLFVGVAAASAANAAEIFVNSNISVPTTWTANNTYNLQSQIYVLPGATLTIEPGTVVASTPTANGSGSLAVTRGAQIFVNGTIGAPVIMTSTADVATWTGGDPTTGTWRAEANEWGNLTVMGAAYISENAVAGNVATCDAGNEAEMEGLLEDIGNPTRNNYGGGDDDDDSGSITYLSLRYGGRVVGVGTELNGLSLGGVGRDTEITGIDIMNNVDDGIEIWGGTANLKYINIWNIGDDSLDIDQGYRGQIQFGLIVQGYSISAAQGSGVGDNCLELDGAEDSDYQPVTTACIYNLTVIGQPIGGDDGTAWRDNARVQLRNCTFMDIGLEVVNLDDPNGDGNGYGHNGTLTWAQTWSTNWNAAPDHANDCAAAQYTAQFSGKLAEITDSVFFRNLNANAYTETNVVGATPANATNDNVLIPGFDAGDAPIVAISRAGSFPTPGGTMLQVTDLDPRPANEATTSVASAPNGPFFETANYRGGFEPNSDPWVCSWTASSAFGFTVQCDAPSDPFPTQCFGSANCPCANNSANNGGCDNSLAGTGGAILAGSGTASLSNDTFVLTATVTTNQPGVFFQGNNFLVPPSFGDGLRCCGSNVVRCGTYLPSGNTTNTATGNRIGGNAPPISNIGPNTSLSPGDVRCYQWWYRDPNGGPCATGFNLSNSVSATWSL